MIKIIKCKCGCGEDIPSHDKKGRQHFWKKNHGRKGIKRLPFSSQWCKNISIGHMGKNKGIKRKFTKEWCINLSNALRGQKRPWRSGPKHHWWKGGITPKNTKIRQSLEYKNFRTAVFVRDNYTCVWCGKVGGYLNVDHIKPFADYPKLRFVTENGRTLCKKCHEKTDTFGWKLMHKKNEQSLANIN